MGLEFPKKDHYSNENVVLDKNMIKGLVKIKEMRKEILDNLLTIQKQCETFWSVGETRRKFRDIREKLNNNLTVVISGTEKRYQSNVFKRDLARGKCASCNHIRSLSQAHVIKKSAFNKLYTKWMFLKYHPTNILFLCNDCHSKFDNRCKDNDGSHIYLTKGQKKRLISKLKKRVKNIRCHMKSDYQYLKRYKQNINRFNDQKEKMLRKLLNTL